MKVYIVRVVWNDNNNGKPPSPRLADKDARTAGLQGSVLRRYRGVEMQRWGGFWLTKVWYLKLRGPGSWGGLLLQTPVLSKTTPPPPRCVGCSGSGQGSRCEVQAAEEAGGVR
jgi:hypothetical protein